MNLKEILNCTEELKEGTSIYFELTVNDVNNKPNTTGSSTMEFRRVCKIMDRKYYMFIYYRYTIIIF